MANSPGSSDEKEKLSDRNLRFERNKRKGKYAFANDEACSNTEKWWLGDANFEKILRN